MKIANIKQRNSSYLLNDLKNFNEIFTKDVAYDNIKSQQNRISLSLQKINFWKNDRGDQIDPPPSSRFRVKLQDKSFHSFIEWSGLNLPVKIYRVQITGKCIQLSFMKLPPPPPRHDLIISPPIQNNLPINYLSKKVFPL